MILDVLKGLQFIHSAGLLHRDLKSPNLLVDRKWTLKIADFGLSVAKHQQNDDAQISLLWTAPGIISCFLSNHLIIDRNFAKRKGLLHREERHLQFCNHIVRVTVPKNTVRQYGGRSYFSQRRQRSSS